MDELQQLYDKMKHRIVVVWSKRLEEGEEGMKGEEEEEEGKEEEEEGMKGEEEEEEEEQYGAGMVINKVGDILTCAHLVPAGFEVHVHRQGEDGFFKAEVLLLRRDLDLAILRTKGGKNGVYKYCKFGDGKSVHMGMRLYSISHHLGINYSFLKGEVSFLRRTVRDLRPDPYTASFPETSTFILINNLGCTPGSFGAPVFGLNGKVYGLTAFNNRLDYAIPVGPLMEMVKLCRKMHKDLKSGKSREDLEGGSSRSIDT